MRFWQRKPMYATPPEFKKSDDPDTVQVSADDDLMTRAEKIVKLLGFSGAVGDFNITVYRALQAYERLDKKKLEKVEDENETTAQ